ncbi:MAG: M23 family metallopeptidase [Clostridia bacterium]|nr:M23 family metallopeptidase [Clostridia bacterium]
MSTIRQPSRFKKFLSGKGFYVVLGLCLLVIAGVTIATFSDGFGFSGDPDPAPSDPDGQQVAEPVTNLPDTRTTVSTTVPTTTRTTAPTTAPTAADPLFVLPGSNEVVKGFSGTTPVFSNTMGDWRCHTGADFGGNEGMTVKAIADGTVVKIEEDPSWGECLVIDHGFGVQSRYCGVTASVKEGEKVSVNDVIGSLSGVPCESADGCHLHLEVTVSGNYVDPVKTIDKEVKYKEESAPSEIIGSR